MLGRAISQQGTANRTNYEKVRPVSTTRYGWSDFEEDESTDEIPEKFVLSIGRLDDRGHLSDDPMAVIVHRASAAFPIDGDVANAKRADAQMIVDALNGQG